MPAELDDQQQESATPGVSDWRSRTILGARSGVTDVPAWLPDSYATLREQVMHPQYPCFFGTIAERRGEMFYAFVNQKDTSTLPATMATFAALASQPEYRRNNIAIFFEPDAEPLSHDEYHDLFWDTLQFLHDQDPDPEADNQPDPSQEEWEFSFGGIQMFVVCACPSFARRHSRNLGPGMVLLFQPRAVFVDTITNKVIGRQARNQVRERLRGWDDVPPHPDLGFYGDAGNLEWKQYFLADQDVAAVDACPFLSRRARNAAHAASEAADAKVEVKADLKTVPAGHPVAPAKDSQPAVQHAGATPPRAVNRSSADGAVRHRQPFEPSH